MARAARSDSRVDTALFVACLALAAFALILPPSLRDPAASALRRSIVAPLVALQTTAERGRTALITHDALTRERDSLALTVQRQAMLERENDRLRRMLGLAADVKWGFVSAEALQGRGPGDDYTIALTAGAAAGIRPFSPVVSPDGLVGMVLTTDPGLSLAIVWAHPDFRVSAMSAEGGAFGIVKAHAGTGASRWLLEMSGVPFRQQLKPGAKVVSSGLGGTYPRGIPVGTVIEELKTAEGYARSYLLRPAVTPTDLSSVMVLLPPRVKSGVDGLWAPSTAETVARAGQSLRDSAAKADDAAVPAAAAPVPSVAKPALRDSTRPPAGVP